MGSITGLQWRPMIAGDIDAVCKLASDIHADYPESDNVLQDKFLQFPAGCFTLVERNNISGYLLSHPWQRYQPPPLDMLLGTFPAAPDTYYIHDLALTGPARGLGMAEQIVDQVANLAASLQLCCVSLVAIGGSEGFWRKQNFDKVHSADLEKRLTSYGAGANYMERPVV